MRRPAAVKRAGPYRVESRVDGSLLVTPTWPEFPVWTAEDGGGPGLLSRLALASLMEAWLNDRLPTPERAAD